MTKRAPRTSGPSHVVDENIDGQAETNDILREGQEAIDAYDYDLARNLLEAMRFVCVARQYKSDLFFKCNRQSRCRASVGKGIARNIRYR
jgi:hypothetical protein